MLRFRAALVIAAATSSAPTAMAPASPGNEKAKLHRCTSIEQGIEPAIIKTANHAAIQHGGWRSCAQAKTIDRLEREAAVGGGRTKCNTQPLLRAHREGLVRPPPDRPRRGKV